MNRKQRPSSTKLLEPAPASDLSQLPSLIFAEAVRNHECGNLVQAEALYRALLTIQPTNVDAWYNLGLLLQTQGQLERAVAVYREAHAQDPKHVAVLSNMATALKDLGQVDEAIATYRLALAIQPNDLMAMSNLGVALKDRGEYEPAIAIFKQALAIKPDDVKVLSNYGVTLFEQGQLEAALAIYAQALTIAPDFALARVNLATALRDLGRIDEAIEEFRRAIASSPQFAEPHYCLGQLLLLKAKFAEGWPEYAWRWKLKEYGWLQKLHGPFKQPLWNGESLAGKTILIYAEQGLGDAIQIIRYVPLVVQRAGRVVLAVHGQLRRLFSSIEGVTLIALTDPLPTFDIHCPLFSLPQMFGTTLETIPGDVPYLRAEPERVARWRERLPQEGFRIGITWQGSPSHRSDKTRSLPLSAFAPLATIPGVQLVSLQKNHGLDQLQSLPEGMQVTSLGPDFDSSADAFLDSAAVMMNLDLIITCDTSIAHLAGALGRPVHLGLAYVPDWRWLLERDDTPWYPTMRLFRQPSRGAWGEPFQRIADDVRQRVLGPVSLPVTTAAGGIRIEASPGELIDKLTILAIKQEKIGDSAKLRNVAREYEVLSKVRSAEIPSGRGVEELESKLKAINEKLWDIEDAIRDCERHKDFGPSFIELARAVYHNNDQRALLKRQINELLNAELVEEKSYAPY